MLRQLTVQAGLQAEQQLLADVCAGREVNSALFWQPTDRALVMPRRMARLANFDAACQGVEASGWPVLLRETGGEPVPQSPATLNIALVYATPRNEGDRNRIEAAYRRLCEPLCEVIRSFGGDASLGEIDGAFCDGRYNVNLDGRKWVGTAQRWRQSLGGTRPVVLVHGAVLLDDERESMVAAVNLFNQRCGLEQRCRPTSHIALREKFSAPQLLETLADAFVRVLAEVDKH